MRMTARLNLFLVAFAWGSWADSPRAICHLELILVLIVMDTTVFGSILDIDMIYMYTAILQLP